MPNTLEPLALHWDLVQGRRTLGSVGAGVDSELKPVSSLQSNKATHD